MWKCPKCDEQMGDAVDACWKCGVTNEGPQAPAVNELPYAEIPDSERREAVGEAYADLGNEMQEHGISGAETARLDLFYVLVVFPFVVLPLACVLRPVAAVVYLLLFVPTWRLCGGAATSGAVWLMVFAILMFGKILLVSVIFAVIAVLLLGVGYPGLFVWTGFGRLSASLWCLAGQINHLVKVGAQRPLSPSVCSTLRHGIRDGRGH
jgi:hypothetical protein